MDLSDPRGLMFSSQQGNLFAVLTLMLMPILWSLGEVLIILLLNQIKKKLYADSLKDNFLVDCLSSLCHYLNSGVMVLGILGRSTELNNL